MKVHEHQTTNQNRYKGDERRKQKSFHNRDCTTMLMTLKLGVHCSAANSQIRTHTHTCQEYRNQRNPEELIMV